jgi:hypothetical protein
MTAASADFGGGQRRVCHGDDGVDSGIDGVDAVKVRLHDLHGRHLAGPDQFGQPSRVVTGEFGSS